VNPTPPEGAAGPLAGSSLLRGHRVLVTGAASGIGAAVAQACEREGANVVRTDARDGDGILGCDVRSEAAVTSLFTDVGQELTDVVHCAGIASTAPIEDVTLTEWDSIIETNLTGSFLVGRAVAQTFPGPGTLTFIASAGGLRGAATYSAYSASKFGVVGLARCLALELAPRRIRVNAVCPGGVNTSMVAKTIAEESARTGVTQDVIRERENHVVPLGRMADSEEIANVCVFLASALASHVAGAAILVDGARNA
jgi:NAD(P)-dependent dehydrogenase (short-subunit alcohol dehydrogenase family)